MLEIHMVEYIQFLKIFINQSKIRVKEGFRKYLTEDLPRGQTIKMVTQPKWDKPFDYVIRLEHMKDDLMKLPFISDVLTESQVEAMSSHGKEIDSWEEFFEMLDQQFFYLLIAFIDLKVNLHILA